MPQYAARVLGFCLSQGPYGLSLADLEHADTAAQAEITRLPMKLDPDQLRVYSALRDMRGQLQVLILSYRLQLQAAQRGIDQLYQGQDDPDAPQASQDGRQESETERGARLLKAALIALVGGPGAPEGGTPARLQRPRPTQPPSGSALQTPAPTPADLPADRIRF